MVGTCSVWMDIDITEEYVALVSNNKYIFPPSFFFYSLHSHFLHTFPLPFPLPLLHPPSPLPHHYNPPLYQFFSQQLQAYANFIKSIPVFNLCDSRNTVVFFTEKWVWEQHWAMCPNWVFEHITWLFAYFLFFIFSTCCSGLFFHHNLLNLRQNLTVSVQTVGNFHTVFSATFFYSFLFTLIF